MLSYVHELSYKPMMCFSPSSPLNYSNRTHLIANDFNEVKWMSIENRIKYLNESHHYNTIHIVNALILPKVGSYGIKSFHYIGAKIWNSLTDEIQTTFTKSL